MASNHRPSKICSHPLTGRGEKPKLQRANQGVSDKQALDLGKKVGGKVSRTIKAQWKWL